jgi:A/G-specific adenine glycosylase
VKAVAPYFEAFARRWPDVAALAAAKDEDVMGAWAGLGYYSRARNLIACARAVAAEHGGEFPRTAAELRKLPGIGPYTAGAIAAIAFGERVPAIDGNVERVVARVFAIDTPLPAAKPLIEERLAPLVPRDRPGEFAEALMDLGATICTPKRPACALCPWREPCRARAYAQQESYPVKAEKRARPTRHAAAYVAVRADDSVLLRRRPPKGLLGGMAEVPNTGWGESAPPDAPPPVPGRWRQLPLSVEHGFTHFHLVLGVWRGDVAADVPAPEGCWWQPVERLAEAGLPTAMRRVVEAALPEAAWPRRENGGRA